MDEDEFPSSLDEELESDEESSDPLSSLDDESEDEEDEDESDVAEDNDEDRFCFLNCLYCAHDKQKYRVTSTQRNKHKPGVTSIQRSKQKSCVTSTQTSKAIDEAPANHSFVQVKDAIGQLTQKLLLTDRK